MACAAMTWETKLELMGYAAQARRMIDVLRQRRWCALLQHVHKLDPEDRDRLHHKGMKDFATLGRSMHRALLGCTAPEFMEATGINNAASLGYNKVLI